MEEQHDYVHLRIAISLILCGWPVVPILGAMSRGTLRYVLLDMCFGVIASGAVVLLVTTFLWMLQIAHKRVPESGPLAPSRLWIVGVILIGFGVLGILSETF